MNQSETLLEIKDLCVEFKTMAGTVHAVDHLSYTLHRGEKLGIVGESGSGKSVSSLAMMQLIPNPPGKVTGGQILYNGKDLVKLSEREMEKIRGNEISMIFQEPMTSLNPIIRCGKQIAESLRLHRGMKKKEAMEEAIASMTMLNKTASCIGRKYDIHACTDVTGFGFLGHLHEMMDGRLSCIIEAEKVPRIEEALHHADEFLLTAAGQKNRNHVEQYVSFENIPFAMEELLFDPQTSGGLLFAVAPEEAESLKKELKESGLPAEIVGEITEPAKKEITVVNA